MINSIDNFLKKEVENHNTPSIQYILFSTEGIIHSFNYGFADIKNHIKVNVHTTYNAFSVTKTFTALAIMQLSEQKKLDIEQPIIKHLPGFPFPPGITIRQLLSHSAGIPNPIPLSWIHLENEHQSFDSDRFFSSVFTRNSKTKSKPNEKYVYSNLGYVLLGQLIEKVSGLAYEKYINDHVLKLLDVQSNELGFTIENSQHAKGYHKRVSFSNLILGFFIDKAKYMDKAESGWKPFNNFYVNVTSYGGLIGTSDAFVKYIQELLKPGCSLLTDDYKTILFTENRTNDNKPTGMCLSWFCSQLNGNKYFAHAGGGGGYYCEIRLYRVLHIGSVVFFNVTGMSDERFLDKVDKIYFENN